MIKRVVLLDIKTKINMQELETKISAYSSSSEFVCFTPYSMYMLEKKNISYKGFHFLNSPLNFKNNVLEHISKIEKNIDGIYFGLMIEFIKFASYLEYEKTIIEIFEHYRDYEIIYMSDTLDTEFDFTNNTNMISNLTYKKEYIKSVMPEVKINKMSNVNFNRIFNKIKSLVYNVKVGYDWKNYLTVIKNIKIKNDNDTDKNRNTSQREEILGNIELTFSNSNFESYIYRIIKNSEFVLQNKKKEFKGTNFFTWVLGFEEYTEAYDKFSFFYQHGNYFYKNMIFKYSEIIPANINFLFNDHTKKIFEDLGAKEVHSVGSILFNPKIRKRKKEYDFLYITQGHDYLGNLQYVDFPNSLHNFDGYDLYQRHKDIIELFGLKNKDKKILIRVHPTVVTNGVYVPFWELSEKYPNIIIDVSIPIHTLIEKSKFIISDYFTSEFINRELHYKRDIILFKGPPTPLPIETIDDMKKMFILVDTVDDLEDKVKNIEEITKDRKRYDDIIEYYSSKKCDTKKVVTEIIEKVLNERR